MIYQCLLLAGVVSGQSQVNPAVTSGAQPWLEYGGDQFHDALTTNVGAAMSTIKWSSPLDDDRSYYGTEVLIHYASPCVSAGNTVVHSYRFTTTSGTTTSYDNWRVVGRYATTGVQKWTFNTDYSAPLVYPQDWTTVFPLCLNKQGSVFAGGGGGTVMERYLSDYAISNSTRISFYSQYASYSSNPSAFKNIKICTPLTSDVNGNVWFGYTVVGSVPSSVAGPVGTGGIVEIQRSGAVSFRSVGSLGINSALTRPAYNAAPAVSHDGNSVYFAVCDPTQATAYLVKLRAGTLALQSSVQLMDPTAPGLPASTINESSASPMIGPDGRVFYGVFGYYYRESHGWMLQFDANLNQNDSTGKRLPVGSFGWDTTPSLVPLSAVPSYTGPATYLVLTKYNNYAMYSGNGENKVAVLDPSSDSVSKDRQTGIPVMNEVLTVLGPTPDPVAIASGFPNAVDEWCINSAAIDPTNQSAIINSEDGHCYRWSFVTNTLTQAMDLAPATGEAYTPTVIGPDGTVFAINNSVLFAIGG